MSGINPISAALLDAAITLGFPVEILQSQLTAGDVLTATVLPPQNGQDLIEILGQQVTAQLPPGIHPGELLVLRVTGFSGNQVIVQNLGVYDPENPIAVTVESQTEDAQTATLTTVRPAPEADAQAEIVAPAPAPQPASTASNAASATPQSNVAPPSAVFVAASVRPAQTAPAADTLEQTNAGRTPVVLPPKDSMVVEARIAAAQTAKQTAPFTGAPSRTPIPGALPARVQSAVQSAVQTAADVVQRTIRTAADLLKALRLPDTPLARTAAAIAPQAQSRLPTVLARLEAALPRESSDPRIATLRTIVAFVARMNPQNEEVLPTQIASFLSHVLEGAEGKLVQLLQAAEQLPDQSSVQNPAEQPPLPAEHAAGASASPDQIADLKTSAVAQTSLEQTVLQARVAERSAAIDHDLKSLVLSLLRQPPQGRSASLTQALNETLVTLTGAQIGVLTNRLTDPGTLQFGLPLAFHEGGKPAQIRVSRDGSGRAQKLDADNFHIAFVLDTANLGTVAIDMHTSGRAVTIDVKTEQKTTAAKFSQTLDSLRSRLENLRYRVTSAAAGVVAAAPSAKTETKAPAVPAGGSGLDMRA